MTDTDTLRKRAEAATPGPWACTRSIPQEGFECFWIKAQPHPAMRGFSREIGTVNGPINDESEATADFIAAANPTAVIALLDEITALRAKVKAQAEALKPFATLSPVSWALEADMYYIDTDDIRRAAQEAGNE